MTVKNCEKLEKSQVALTVEVSAEEFEAAVEKTYQKMRRKISVPGFRPGKAPRKMIERMYGAEVFFEEAINIAFPEAYEAAVKEQELQVVGYPSVEIEGQVTRDGFTFKATAPVYPEVTLGQYKGLSAPKEEVKVSVADVDERLKALTDRNTRLVSVDREAKEGDTVVIDFEGFLEGKPFEGGKGENFSLELGSHTFVPGFEEQLVGVKAGDEKDLDITFPEDYHKDLAGKAVVFKVKVHEVKEKEIPALDDEFAKDVSEFDTLKDLKADLKKKITEERQKDADRVFEENLMNQVAENITADIPDVMVENQAHQYLDNFKAQISRQFPYEEYKKMTGMDDAKLLEDAKEPALRQVKMDLATAAIIKAENIEASDEDVEAEFKKLAEQFGMDVDMVKKYLSKEQVHDQILTQKAVAVVVDSATAEKPKKAAAKKAAPKKVAKKADKSEELAEDLGFEADGTVEQIEAVDAAEAVAENGAEMTDAEKVEAVEEKKAEEAEAFRETEEAAGDSAEAAKEEAEKAQTAAKEISVSGGAAANMPTTTLTDADFTDGQIGVLTLLVKCGLASSNGEARKLVQGGGVSLNGEKVADFKQQLAKDFFNEECMIKKGKKTFHKAILG